VGKSSTINRKRKEKALLHDIFVQPLINFIFVAYSLLGHNFGLAVILLTVVIRLILWPFQSQTLRNQKALNKIQPDIKKIQAKYKNDPAKMNAMMMELYKEKEVNPFSSCLPTLIQLPLILALFYAIRPFGSADFVNMANHANGLWNELYTWVKDLGFVQSALTGTFDTNMFGLINLAKPSILLAIIAGITQYIQMRMTMPRKNLDDTQKAMSSMLYIFPVLTVIIGISFPAALPLYWIVSTLMLSLQQYLVMRGDIEELEEKK
jgi:YidC/Oxa1 family membrane protein insertase